MQNCQNYVHIAIFMDSKRKRKRINEEKETQNTHWNTKYARHQELMNIYLNEENVEDTSNTANSTEMEILRNNFQFLRNENQDIKQWKKWEIRMSVNYYKKLYKEYALADLSRYKTNEIGLRWRTKQEVIIGKGHFLCGNKKCQERNKLHTYEIFFQYKEHEEMKQCLVKLRVCEVCAMKLFYNKFKKFKKISKISSKKLKNTEEINVHEICSQFNTEEINSQGLNRSEDAKDTQETSTFQDLIL